MADPLSTSAAALTSVDRALPRSPILLVDDREENLLALRAVVEPLGHPVITAPSGMEALRVLLREDVAVILLDVQMPDLDGFETAAHIKGRERTRHIPIIFLTAISADAHHVLRGYAEGAVDYLTKPFDPNVLRSKVAVFLELHQARLLLQEQAQLLEQRLAQQEEAEAALRVTAADLARSNEELDQFAAVVSHDLLAPLATTSGVLAALAEDHGETMGPAGLRLLERGERNLAGMRSLIDRLLAWSQASLGPLNFEAVELAEVVAAAVEACQAAIDAAGATVYVGPLAAVKGDPAQLGELAQNLLTNAIKFGRPGVSPHVSVESVPEDNGIALTVADDGIGVDRARTGELFGMFTRVGEKQGRGIGLAVCQRIVERHGGRIWLEPRDGGGTIAKVWLPATHA